MLPNRGINLGTRRRYTPTALAEFIRKLNGREYRKWTQRFRLQAKFTELEGSNPSGASAEVPTVFLGASGKVIG